MLNHATQITGLARAELTANTERNLWRLLESKVGASGTAPGACRPRPGSLFVPLRLPALFVRSGIIRTHVGVLGSAGPMAHGCSVRLPVQHEVFNLSARPGWVELVRPAERLPQLERRRANPAVAHLHAPGLGLTPLSHLHRDCSRSATVSSGSKPKLGDGSSVPINLRREVS